jgi:hypothetical protein
MLSCQFPLIHIVDIVGEALGRIAVEIKVRWAVADKCRKSFKVIPYCNYDSIFLLTRGGGSMKEIDRLLL